jgi:retinoid hydroxylase
LGTVPGSETTQLSTWFSQLTNGLFAIPLRWPGTTYAKALQARDHLLAHLETVIVARQASPSQDALGLLVQSVDENGDRLSLTELKVQALLMLFAGHETTTSMLTCLAMALAQHPEIEQRCRQEQAALVAEGPLCMAQLRQMPYLEQVLKEVERLYPPVGGGFRGVVKPLAFQGYQIPAGWQALYRIDATHRDPRCFADPLTFDPDRFSPERAEHRQFEFNLVGFGGGPRICLGLAFAQMELKIVAALLLRHYAWELLPGQDLTTMAIPTLRPKSGLKVRFAQLNAA